MAFYIRRVVDRACAGDDAVDFLCVSQDQRRWDQDIESAQKAVLDTERSIAKVRKQIENYRKHRQSILNENGKTLVESQVANDGLNLTKTSAAQAMTECTDKEDLLKRTLKMQTTKKAKFVNVMATYCEKKLEDLRDAQTRLFRVKTSEGNETDRENVALPMALPCALSSSDRAKAQNTTDLLVTQLEDAWRCVETCDVCFGTISKLFDHSSAP